MCSARPGDPNHFERSENGSNVAACEGTWDILFGATLIGYVGSLVFLLGSTLVLGCCFLSYIESLVSFGEMACGHIFQIGVIINASSLVVSLGSTLVIG